MSLDILMCPSCGVFVDLEDLTYQFRHNVCGAVVYTMGPAEGLEEEPVRRSEYFHLGFLATTLAKNADSQELKLTVSGGTAPSSQKR